jgi:hypothetical protein
MISAVLECCAGVGEVTVVASTQREDYVLSPANGVYESLFYESLFEAGQSVR